MGSSDSEGTEEIEEVETIASTIKVGWLTKKGGSRKSIKKRWFVLSKTSIKYFKSEKLGKCLGTIYLRRIQSVEEVQDSKGPNAIAIAVQERTYIIFAQSPEEQTSWIQAIKNAIPAQNTDGLAIVKQGWLTKQGGGYKSWKKRWFVLRKDNLFSYFKQEGDPIILGTIDLEKCLDVRMASTEDVKGNAFEIVTKERTYIIVANTKEEMDQWMFVLLEIVGNTVDGNNVSASRFIDDDDEIIPQDELSNFIKMDTKIMKQGYLIKQGGRIKTWKRRWFVLRESTLAYYKDEKEDKPQGLILLKDCQGFELASRKASKPFAFEISTPDRIYICCAKDDEEMWGWINVLSNAVSNAGGKETLEFIALQKASELAQKKQALKLKVLRKAAIKNLRRNVSRYRHTMNASKGDGNQANWKKDVEKSSEKNGIENFQEEKDKLLNEIGKGNQTPQTADLAETILLMEKDIAELNPNKLKKQGSYPDSDDAIYSPSYLCYAEAVQDYVPNAYDDEALSFTKGELIGIEEKDPSGNWKGTCLDPATKASLGKSGYFPSRYVQELDQEPDGVDAQEPEPWTEQLDSAAGNLFEMYDSDGDGYMTKLDFFEFLYEFGKTFLTDKQVDRCWETLDVSKMGKVDSTDFRNGIRILDQEDFYSSWNP